MKEYLDMFLTFARIGGLTFGGGYAMLPMLQREIVEKHKWATEDDVLDYYAIGQCTPGIIAVNTATFVGVKLAGALGGAVSTVAVVCPSLIIITIISTILRNFAEYAVVQHAFAGIRVAVAALVVVSVVKLFKKGVKDVLGYVIFAVSLLLVFFLDVSPIWVVLAAIAIGVGKALKAGKGGEQA